MRTLVIGCGYVGRRVAAAWHERGHEVLVTTRSRDTAAEFRSLGWQPILGDVTVPGSLSVENVDTALYAVGLDRRGGHSHREVYVDGLRNVLDSLGGRVGRWVYLSSTSVYGQEDGSWVDESSPTVPLTPNGLVCLEAEQVLRQFVPAALVVRLAGIYGPGRLIGRVDSLRAGIPLTSRPDGWLNLVHVDDIVSTVLACQEKGIAGKTYLAADDCPLPRQQFYDSICRLIGAPPPVFAPAGSEGLGKRCSNRRVREELGVRLRFPTIETGLPNALGLGG